MNVPAHLFKQQENQKQRVKKIHKRFCLNSSDVIFNQVSSQFHKRFLVHVFTETEQGALKPNENKILTKTQIHKIKPFYA